MNGICLHNDEPTLEDLVERSQLVKNLGDQIATCDPPYVFGIHGDWGSGKTSFLHQLHYYLTGECPQQPEPKVRNMTKPQFWEAWKAKDYITVVWFEAWRYQNESAPIVALLQEIRTQLPVYSKFLSKAGKLGEVSIRGALLALEDMTKKIGIQASKIEESGEKWEREHLAMTLPSHHIRQHLEKTIDQLLGHSKKEPKRRLVVLIDDLDRCSAESAYKMLEGIKIYLNIPNCVFVLGMNQKIIESAIAKHVPVEEDDRKDVAHEYLEKLCQNIFHLPMLHDTGNYLSLLLKKVNIKICICDQVTQLIQEYRCLPANPRKIKAFVNTFILFLDRLQLLNEENTMKSARKIKLLIVIVFIYEYFHELYRVLEGDAMFYEEIRRWSKGVKSDYELLTSLKGLQKPDTTLESEMEEEVEPEMQNIFTDPAQGTIFRVQSLINSIGRVSKEEIEELLVR